MVFESMTCLLLTVGLFTYYSKKYGLGQEVPMDPSARAGFWANECLGMLKTNLSRAAIRDLQPHSLGFEGESGKGRIACQQGKLSLQLDGQEEQLLSHPEEKVELSFERLSDTGLLAKIRVSVPPDASHELGLRLEVSYP